MSLNASRLPALVALALTPVMLFCFGAAPRAQDAAPNAADARAATRQDPLAEATALTKQVSDLFRQGKFDEALPPAERALALREKALGETLLVAVSLNQVAVLYQAKGDLGKSEHYLRRALAINEKVLGRSSVPYGRSLNGIGVLLRDRGDFRRAEQSFLEALAIFEKAPDGRTLAAMVVNNLATLYQEMGLYDRAQERYRQTLRMRREELGDEHPEVALALNNLSALYQAQGDYVEAEKLIEQAVAIRRKTLGEGHPDVAMSLTNLASVQLAKGDSDRAEALFARALESIKKTYGENHHHVSALLNNLAGIRADRGDLNEAGRLFEEALRIDRAVYGETHPEVALALNNLASVYKLGGDTGRARALMEQSLSMYRQLLGDRHPDVGLLLNNLAAVNQTEGNYELAERQFTRSLDIRTKALGARHPDVASTLNNLATLHWARGDLARAADFVGRAAAVREHNLGLILSTGSENQKRLYLETLAGETSSLVSLGRGDSAGAAAARRVAFTAVLQRKGRALDAMSGQIARLRGRLDAQDRALLDELSATRTRLATLTLGGPGKAAAAAHDAEIARLEAEAERLQVAVARRSVEFRAQTQPVTAERVRLALPPGTALVEFYSYQPFDPKAPTPRQSYGPPRYVAYVLGRGAEPLSADLGEAAGVDADVSRLLAAMKCPQSTDDITRCPPVAELKRQARALDERIMRPVRRLLGDTRALFVSPDGMLNLLPFAALVEESGNYLVERYSLTYLTSGRDMLRLSVSAESQQPPLIVADPAFGGPASGATDLRTTQAAQPKNERPAGRPENIEVNFKQLPGTAQEAEALASILHGARVLQRAEATEAALKQVHAPRVLHVATHGFFLPDRPAGAANGARGLGLGTGAAGARVLNRSDNPLLRSGLALAGANLPPEAGGEDGILTALEAAGLDLWGTGLVVLSACETGVGQVSNGEGVYGLRRALVLAGSESQVMSLWQVSDEVTKDLMIGYYKRLLANGGRTEALRQVQLEMLKGGGRVSGGQGRELGGKGLVAGADRSHPFFWAPFIQSGDWRGISIQPARHEPR